MKDEFVKSIGIWGQRHYNYLKRKSPTVINAMRLKGTIEQYLQDVDRDAEEMFSQLIKQLAKRDDITEALKAADQMEWVRRMNAIRAQATETRTSNFLMVTKGSKNCYPLWQRTCNGAFHRINCITSSKRGFGSAFSFLKKAKANIR